MTRLRLIRSRRPASLLLTIVAALLSFAAPAVAAQPQADLAADASVTAASGMERSVRLTLTNLGPDEAYAGDDGPELVTNFQLQFSVFGADVIETSIPCEDDPNVTGAHRCGRTKRIPVGRSISVDVRVRVTDPRSFGSGIGVGVGGDGRTVGSGPEYSSEDPNAANDSKLIYFSNVAACQVTAKSPQKLSRRRLVLTVVAPATSGCKAELEQVALRVGQKVRYRLLQPRSRTLRAKEKWRVELRYGALVGKTLLAARGRGKNVSARAAFSLGGTRVVKDVVLR